MTNQHPITPPPEPPTDEEILELTENWPATTGPRHDLSGCPEVPLYSIFADEVVDFARAVLERWGNYPVIPVSSIQVSPPEQPTEAERLADFSQWLAREMPPNTIIGDPLWWAPRIARAVFRSWRP